MVIEFSDLGDNIMGDVEMVQNGLNVSVLGYESPGHNANSVAVQSSKNTSTILSSSCTSIIVFLIHSHIVLSYFTGQSTRKDCIIILTSAIPDKKLYIVKDVCPL
jgi:hypothetical protein